MIYPNDIDYEITRLQEENLFLRDVRNVLSEILKKTHYINQVKRLEVLPYEFLDFDLFYNPN